MEKNTPVYTGQLREVQYQGVTAPKKKLNKEELRKQLDKKRQRDAELVTGVFTNLESRGGWLSFGLKLYPGEPFKFWTLFDGERYSLPRGVVNHLNNNCHYFEYKHLPGESGSTGVRAAFNDGSLGRIPMQSVRKVHRFRFDPLDFMDEDTEIRQSDLISVEVNESGLV